MGNNESMAAQIKGKAPRGQAGVWASGGEWKRPNGTRREKIPEKGIKKRARFRLESLKIPNLPKKASKRSDPKSFKINMMQVL